MPSIVNAVMFFSRNAWERGYPKLYVGCKLLNVLNEPWSLEGDSLLSAHERIIWSRKFTKRAYEGLQLFKAESFAFLIEPSVSGMNLFIV